MIDMKLKAAFRRWFAPVRNKEEMIRRYRTIAVREALIAAGLLLLHFTVPLWAAEALVSRYSAAFLAGAGIFAALAASTLWSAALIKRDIY